MIRIRPPRDEDAAALVAMVAALSTLEGDEVGRFDEAAARRFVIAPEGPVSCLIAEEGARPVGFVFWHVAWETPIARPGAFVTDLYVVEERRGGGLGLDLLRAAAREVKAAGGAFLWLTALRRNERARAFYRRFMEEEAHIANYWADGARFDALLLGAAPRASEPDEPTPSP